MSRELAVRIPGEIGAWVRQQQGSVSETVLSLAKAVWDRRESITVRDPGAGEARVKLRLERRVIQFIRAGTHSRDTTAAIRKLLRWGYEGRALPAAPTRRVLRGDAVTTVPVAALSRLSLSPAREVWDGVEINAGVPAHPTPGMPLISSHREPDMSERPPQVPEPVSRVLAAIPDRVLAFGVPMALMLGAYFLLKSLKVVASAGKVSAGVVKIAPAVKVIPWVPL